MTAASDGIPPAPSRGSSENDSAEAFAKAVAIMARLRAPGGCPWDREQTFDSIRRYTLEETYEVLDAIERRNWPDLKEELGDLLLQVLFYVEMAAEPGYFTLTEVIAGLIRKLIRRHPHVFGDEASIAAGNPALAGMETSGIDASQVLRNWEQIKRAEKAPGHDAPASLLDAVPRSFPALMEANKLGSKAAKVGFDWPDAEGVFTKLQEEIAELREAVAEQGQHPIGGKEAGTVDPVAGELGDLLFTVVNLSRRLGVDPEMALRQTNRKFRQRFAAMEKSSDRSLDQQSLEQLESLWVEAKVGEQSTAEVGAKK